MTPLARCERGVVTDAFLIQLSYTSPLYLEERGERGKEMESKKGNEREGEI